MIVSVFNLHCIHDLMKNDSISNITNLFNSIMIIKELYLIRKKTNEQVDREIERQQRDGKIDRQRDGKTERQQRDGKIDRQRDGKIDKRQTDGYRTK